MALVQQAHLLKEMRLSWEPRVAQGEETLINHAIQGFNAMPARGTCADCSDDEIAATVKFLIKDLIIKQTVIDH